MAQATNNQNLLKSAGSVSFESKHSPEFLKGIALDILVVIAALAFGFCYRLYVLGSGSLWSVFVAFAIFGVLTSLEVLLIKSIYRRLFIILLESLAVVVLFLDRIWWAVLISLGILLVFQIAGEWHARSDFKNSIEQHYARVSRIKLKKMATGIALVAVILFLPNLNSQSVKIESAFVSPQMFETFYSWTVGVIKNINPHIEMEGTVGDFISGLAEDKLQTEEFKNLSVPEQDQLKNSAIKDVTDQLNKTLNQVINPEEKTSQFFYNLAIQYLGKWRAEIGNWFLVAWLVFFFLFVRTIGFLFSILIAGISYLVIQILLVTGFINIATENRTKESISF
jgi:hypothetical protein